MMDFTGRTAIVTGAAKGIGLAVAMRLAREHARVALVDINEQNLAEAKAKIDAFGIPALTYVCDVRNEADVQGVVEDAERVMGKVDILVNNAGIFLNHVMPFVESKSEYWKEKFDINVFGTMYFSHAVLPYMQKRGYGRIVNLSSIVAVYGSPNRVDYSTSKGAIVSFTSALAKEVAKDGIMVNAVAPGMINPNCEPCDMNFIGRNGSPDECAAVICFLASEDASYITGQNILVDGLRRITI